jgi:uncharacterized protein
MKMDTTGGCSMARFMSIITMSLILNLLLGNAGVVRAKNHSEEVSFTSGDAVFSGTLTLPEAPGPYPGVVLISGMGQQDRDWAFVGGKYKFAKGIANHLTAKGIAVLRYDDRGHGKSTGAPETETAFDQLAEDVNAAVIMLRKRNDIAKIGVCGHSLGGIIAPYMQVKYDAADFVIIVSGSFVAGEKISIDQAKTMPQIWRLSKDMTDEECTETGIRFAKSRSQYARNGEGLDIVEETLYRLINWQIDNLTEAQIEENLQHYKDVDEFRKKSYEGALRYYTSPHQLSFVSHDPAKYIAKVKCPILVLFGDKDKHVTVEKNRAPLMHVMADSLTRDFTVKIIADADHVYTTFGLNQEWDILPEILNCVTRWIQARAGNEGHKGSVPGL